MVRLVRDGLFSNSIIIRLQMGLKMNGLQFIFAKIIPDRLARIKIVKSGESLSVFFLNPVIWEEKKCLSSSPSSLFIDHLKGKFISGDMPIFFTVCKSWINEPSVIIHKLSFEKELTRPCRYNSCIRKERQKTDRLIFIRKDLFRMETDYFYVAKKNFLTQNKFIPSHGIPLARDSVFSLESDR
ncbi:MAG: hypothetical protein AB1585_02455 [Thermodesulfobacteriota bacterium]